jgi:hypothetical protein
MFVEAPDDGIARAIARDHIERKFAAEWFTIFEAAEYHRPVGGRVLE